MAGDGSKDPSATFQEWVTQWERAFDKASNEVMGTEDFAQSLNQMQNLQLELQRSFGELMARQLATFNMPSRDDVLDLAAAVRDMDRRLARIETQIRSLVPDGVNHSAPKRQFPPRTKKPPAKSRESSADD